MSRRILFVVPALDPLGAVRQVRALTKHFVAKNYDVHVADMGGRSFLPELEATTHSLRKLGRRDLGMVFRLRRLIQRLNPEIVHAWGKPAIDMAGLALSDILQVRFICSELETRTEPSFVKRQFRRRFHRRPEKLTVPHESLREYMIEEGVREHRLAVVPNGAAPFAIGKGLPYSEERQVAIEAAREKLRQTIGIPQDSIIACAAARLEPKFRLKDLIWAADLLAYIRDDFHLVLFGEGFQHDRLKKFLMQTDATPFVHFMGLPENTEELLAGMDVFWNSHLRLPGNSLLLSAMAEGIPSVSVLGTGVEEIVVPQVSALATNFGARDEFSRWTKYLIEQAESRKKLARQGMRHVTTEFSLEKMFAGFDHIYDWGRSSGRR